MSDQAPQSLTEAQRNIINSIPVLYPAVISISERMALTERIADLEHQLRERDATIARLELCLKMDKGEE